MWIARDKCGKLCLFNKKPVRNIEINLWCLDQEDSSCTYLVIDEDLTTEYKFLTWDDEPVEVNIYHKYTDTDKLPAEIVLTKYFQDYDAEKSWFMDMIDTCASHKYDSVEEKEQLWEEHCKVSFYLDEIWALEQCDGYTRVLFQMSKHKHHPSLDKVMESKEYIEKYFNTEF